MLDDLTLEQKKVIAVIIAIAVIGIIYFIYKGTEKNNKIELEQDMLVQNTSTNYTTSQSDKSDEMIIIHIAGAVKTPGVVKLIEGSRIEDAVEAAGGLTEDADITNVNLAYVLEDGTKIKIPSLLDVNLPDEETEIITEDSGQDIIEKSSDSTSSTRHNKYKQSNRIRTRKFTRNRTITCNQNSRLQK